MISCQKRNNSKNEKIFAIGFSLLSIVVVSTCQTKQKQQHLDLRFEIYNVHMRVRMLISLIHEIK